jgi:hypothetical protein
MDEAKPQSQSILTPAEAIAAQMAHDAIKAYGALPLAVGDDDGEMGHYKEFLRRVFGKGGMDPEMFFNMMFDVIDPTMR